jgi:cytoskeletal protein CcmA (bactofilin family)
MKKNSAQINALLGKETEFEGKLAFTGAVRIDGRFKGEILSEGTLIVGETAYIESDIHASNVIISGEVHGNISAGARIEIYAPGKVFGNLQSPILTVEEGVVFEGNCQMSKEAVADDKKVAVLHNDKEVETKTSS